MSSCNKCNGTGEIVPAQEALNSIEEYSVGETIKFCSCEDGKRLAENNLNAVLNTKPFQN